MPDTWSAVLFVGFFLDQSRAELYVDALLDRGAFVVGDIHRTCQLDEFPVKSLLGFLVADPVLDVPQLLVDRHQPPLFGADVVGGSAAVLPGRFEQGELEFDVVEFGGLLDARQLDTQDSDLVQELARGQGYEYVFHKRDPSNSSIRSVTCSTVIRSMTPGTSILWVHGRACGSQPRKRRAAS